jgi:hypothetical protein
MPRLEEKTCPHCLRLFKPFKRSSIHCSRACQSAAIQAKKAPLTQNRLKVVLRYDPETGVFTWLAQRGGTAAPGTIAGVITGNRRLIGIDGVLHRANRLAWLYMTGEWPVGEVDHRDTDSLNDRWLNLRDVSRQVNQQNMRAARGDNKSSGLLGVSRKKGQKSFYARIHLNGKTQYLGSFPTVEEAHSAYVEAKRKLHEGNTL